MTRFWIGCFICALALSPLACGNDIPGFGDVDGGGDGDTDTDTDADTDADSDADSDSDADTDGACTNDDDLAVLSEPTTSIDKAMEDCGMECIGMGGPGPDTEACMTECITETTGLSIDCAACFSASAICVFENCFEECMMGDGSECDPCMEESGCNAEFAECSGLDF